MPTFANDDNGNAPLYYIPITLSANDGSGFQQKADFNPSAYSSSYFASDLSNINFQDGAGNLLYSWQETHAPTTSSTDVIYWVVLPNGTATTVYLVIVGTALSSYSTTHTGVEPTYSGTYGQYDNGASIFGFYDNFAGTSLSGSWTTTTDGGGSVTYSVSDGLSLTAVSGNYWQGIITTTPQISSGQLMETYMQTQQAYGGIRAYSGSGGAGGDPFAFVAGELRYPDSPPDWGIESSDPTTQTTYGGSSNAFQYYMVSQSYTSSSNLYADYSLTLTSSFTVTTTSAPLGLMAYNAGTFPVAFQYVRTRTYPTGGTMPSASFGSVTSATYSGLLSYFA